MVHREIKELIVTVIADVITLGVAFFCARVVSLSGTNAMRTVPNSAKFALNGLSLLAAVELPAERTRCRLTGHLSDICQFVENS